MGRTCSNCDQPASKKCVGCEKAWYCGPECQRKHWKHHIFDCKRTKPIPTAYYLCQAAYGNDLPNDPQTCKDYGFTRTIVFQERSQLLGLYIALFVQQEIEPKDVHRWRNNGILIQEIKSVFEKLPPNKRGEYYSWFLDNQHFVDPSLKAIQDPAVTAMKRTWEVIGEDPSVTSDHWGVVLSWSNAKQQSFALYHALIHGWHPSPDLEAWIPFGFCACRSEWQDHLLSRLYSKVIIFDKCPLDKFAAAHASKSLPTLFREHGVDAGLMAISQIKEVLEKEDIASVWYLKAYVLQELEHEEMIASFRLDYGIINCQGVVQYIQLLKDVYRRFFKHPNGDPMELHAACMQGDIFAYIDTVIEIKKRDAKLLRRLMKNRYPLHG